MNLSTVPSAKAKAEAADWFARLNRVDVSAADMEAFRVWRKAEGHKEAYDEVDAFWRRSKTLQDDPDIQDAMAATLARTATPPRRAGPRRAPLIGLGLAFGALVIAVGAYRVLGPQTYGTRVGEQRLVRLADGSTVMLDTDSKVIVRLSEHHRDLELRRGRAMFDVAHDADRPFVVQAGATSVKALGTRFDVRREDGGAEVTLVRGAVEVREAIGPNPAVWRLAPGQALSTTTRAPKPTPVDVATRTSWTTGRLVFNNVPLNAAVAEVNRYDKTQVVLDVGPLESAKISGAFDVGDTETFVGSVAELNDFTVSRPSPGVIRLVRPKPPSTVQ